ncbi:MAG: nucleotide sugar dehydrogenase [Candidatus Wallbacteria bacterium]|nr:nucleotide sugar dehydrogenase [Candidatus Wallbacteria bacterium]
MKVCVFGLWHLGCVTAACLAELGFNVTGLDFDQANIADLRMGKAPLSEPGLDDLIKEGLKSGRLSFSSEASAALNGIDALWVTFDTPVNENDVADPGFIENMLMSIAPKLKSGVKIIISSQVPAGFTKKLKAAINKMDPGRELFFAYSPENLRLGKAIKVFLEPDRIIIGSLPDEKALFTPLFSAISSRLEWMSIESAEMTKHAINAFLAASVSFANEIAVLCESVGADAKDVERGLKTEDRIGPKAYLSPGVAFSGGTLARDIVFLSETGNSFDLPLHLIKAVKESNDFHKGWVQRKCLEIFGGLSGRQMAVLGLTYKPGTDTLRRSFSVELCCWLNQQGAVIKAFDPSIKELPGSLKGVLSIADSIKNAVLGADCMIVATEWPVFRELDPETIREISGCVVIDPNGFIEKQLIGCSGINYVRVGRQK